jgi:ligand-binding sensor domain-containing protein/serine phosphatase RsbU (regulator of sigma subunit)
MKKILIIYLISFLQTILVFAQKPGLKFERITDKSGRSLGYITGIVQDKSGFIWFSTRSGLYRYDGYNYKLFKNDPNDSLSLSTKNITAMYHDNSDILWLRHFKQFTPFYHEKRNYDYTWITQNEFDFESNIVEDSQHNLWIGPTEKGLYKFDRKNKNVDVFKKSMPQYSPTLYGMLDSLMDKGKIISRLTKISNKKDTTLNFSINAPKDIIIISVGESDKRENYDYGFILSNRRLFWQMNANSAKYAGGSEKNKIHIEYKKFPKGEYQLRYISDNSGAYNDWKAENKPLKPEWYGILLLEIDIKDKYKFEKLINQIYTPKNSILSNNFKDLILNKDGNLVFASPKGFEIYNPKDGFFFHHLFNLASFLGVDENEIEIQKLFQDKQGFFWIGTKSQGLIRYNIETHEFKAFRNSSNNELISSNFILSIFEDSRGNLWIGTDNGLSLYDRTNDQFYNYKADIKNRLYDNFIIQITEDNAGNIWIATPEGLNRLKKSDFKFFRLNQESNTNLVHIDKREGENKCWFNSSKDALLYCYDQTTNQKLTYFINPKHYPYNEDTKTRLFTINDMFEDKNGFLWLAIDDGLYYFDRRAGKIIDSIEVPNLKIKNLVTAEYNLTKSKEGISDNILKIKEGRKANLWLFTLSGVYNYNIATNKLEQFYSFNIEIEYLYDVNYGFIKNIIEDKHGNYWIRTSSGIFIFNPEKGTIELKFEFPSEIKGSSASDGNIWESADGCIWYAILPNLYRYNYSTKKQEVYRCKEAIDVGYSHIKETKDSLLWIYSDNGLFRFNQKDKTFKKYTTDDGLADKELNGLVDDNRGNLWITSSKSLCKFDKATESFDVVSSEFDSNNFLRISEENRSKHGEITFFTDLGFYSFYPDSINRHIPQLAITRIVVNNEEFNFDSLVYEKRRIYLNWDQNFLTLEFAALDFTDPNKNLYSYKLEGLDKSWVNVDAQNRKAVYTGISAKNYVFRLKGANNDKVWNEAGIAIEFLIKPPFWETPLFYALCVIFIVLTIIFFIKWRERNLQREKRILEEKVVERTAEIERQKEEIKAQRDLATKQRDQIGHQKKAIMDSIHYALRIQRAILPPENMIKSIVPEYFILYKPRDVVSGDYYWFTQRDNKFIITAADCTGHGVPGAFMSMLGVASLNEIVNKQNITNADQILNELKSYIIRSLHQTGKEDEAKDGMDIALSVIDYKTMNVEFAGAYNPLYHIRNKELVQINADRMPIGIYSSEKKAFTKNIIDFQYGDSIYMFSDGYADQFGAKTGRKFMSKQFKALLIEIQDKTMEEQKTLLDANIEQWRGDLEQVDDILVIGLRL